MPLDLDSATREALMTHIRFCRELGLTELYRRPVDPALMAQLSAEPTETASISPTISHLERSAAESKELRLEGAPCLGSETGESIGPKQTLGASSIRQPLGEWVGDHEPASALQLIRDEIGECTRCPLHQGRHKIVFGDGDPAARLMFVGEGPGADEDAQGLPFVGKAGQLLNNMIAAMGLKREEVYIANVVKCRPPGNRVPEQIEGDTCAPFLFRQIDAVRPQVLVALGATAATWLLGARQPLAGLRGRIHSVRGAQLIVTYHPAYLLRDPRQKKEAWADLQMAMKILGLKPPLKG